MHKSLLVTSSNFFRAALKEPWEECKGQVKLLKEKPGLFELYVQYLYHGKIFSCFSEDNPQTHDEWIRLWDLYILGDCLQDECFRNSVLDALVEKANKDERYPTQLAADTYANTPPGSPMRRLIVDFHVWTGQGGSFTKTAHNKAAKHHDYFTGPREFFLDTIVAFADAGPDLYKSIRQKPRIKDPCVYHEHKDTPPRKK